MPPEYTQAMKHVLQANIRVSVALLTVSIVLWKSCDGGGSTVMRQFCLEVTR